jgi:hypothetical protein
MTAPLPRLRLIAVLAALAAALAYPLVAADNPVHTPPPREVVNPLYEGKSDAAALAPLQAWVKERCADGTCTVEQLQRELQTALNDIHDRTKTGHRIIMDDIKAAKTARENLLKEIAAAKATGQPLTALAEKISRLPAIPTARIWGDPHVDQKPAATTTTASSSKRAGTTTSAGSVAGIAGGATAGRTITASSSPSATTSTGDLDVDAVVTKLKADLAELTKLAQQTQQDLQTATTRMQQATAALAQQSKAFHEAAMASIRNLKG